jgi:cystathionine beta-lyase/cystathionine gamma-synthase
VRRISAPSVTFAAEYGTIGFSAAGTDERVVPFAYAREGHPTAAQLEERLTLLDGGLEQHPKVTWVRYPGLPSHPQRLTQRQMALASGMIAFHVDDAKRFGAALSKTLRVFTFAARRSACRAA